MLKSSARRGGVAPDSLVILVIGAVAGPRSTLPPHDPVGLVTGIIVVAVPSAVHS